VTEKENRVANKTEHNKILAVAIVSELLPDKIPVSF
jgi:hypothetical protein